MSDYSFMKTGFNVVENSDKEFVENATHELGGNLDG